MHSVTNAIPTGTIASIPAKAHAHRALICAALAICHITEPHL